MHNDSIVHIKLSDISAYSPKLSHLFEDLADIEFTTTLSKLSEEAVDHFLRLHPIAVTKSRHKYHVVAGIRSFQIAQLKLKQEDTVTCVLIKSKKVSEDLAKADILLSPIVFSLSTKVVSQTEKLIDLVGQSFTNNMHSDLNSFRSVKRVHKRSR